jgi:hypothetical protein
MGGADFLPDSVWMAQRRPTNARDTVTKFELEELEGEESEMILRFFVSGGSEEATFGSKLFILMSSPLPPFACSPPDR